MRLMHRFPSLVVILSLVLWVNITYASGGQVVFSRADPAGDDRGPGTYTYPRHAGFKPYSGLLDLLHFQIVVYPDRVAFECSFAYVTNPWEAPENYFHQIIDVYIDCFEGGETRPARKGARVRFADAYAWDIGIRARPWGQSEIVYAGSVKGELPVAVLKNGGRPGIVSSVLLGDGRTIRITVPKEALPLISPDWHYYVLIGAYDRFGLDCYRSVAAQAGDWVFGGGVDDDINPNVIDMLAASWGPYGQRRMLSSYDVDKGEYAVIYPTGCRWLQTVAWYSWVWPFLLTIAITALGVYIYTRRRGALGG